MELKYVSAVNLQSISSKTYFSKFQGSKNHGSE